MIKKLQLATVCIASLFFTSCDNEDVALNATVVADRQILVTFEVTGPLAFGQILLATHDGSYDFFTLGDLATPSLETMAELGNVSQLLADVPSSGSTAFSSNPSALGTSFSAVLTINEVNKYFSYASMVLPSSDSFIGNDNPFSIDLSPLLTSNTPIILDIDQLYDAGTEVNDFATSPGGPFVGQFLGVAADGVDENTNVTLSVENFYDDYLNINGFDLSQINPEGSNLAQITISLL